MCVCVRAASIAKRPKGDPCPKGAHFAWLGRWRAASRGQVALAPSNRVDGRPLCFAGRAGGAILVLVKFMIPARAMPHLIQESKSTPAGGNNHLIRHVGLQRLAVRLTDCLAVWLAFLLSETDRQLDGSSAFDNWSASANE